ncbi:hypothetical protein VTK73DRAFT_1479 [Phialemonium thermophilum]|uniref:Secreted protein n=1 Tax=Phialemonium thermophilum TaxID=223376 RepID=A0ABR3VTF0_9PEZI
MPRPPPRLLVLLLLLVAKIVQRQAGEIVDPGDQGVHEDAAGPGEARAEGAHEGELGGRRVGHGRGGRAKQVLARGQVELLEDAIALVVADGQGNGEEGGEEDGGLLAPGDGGQRGRRAVVVVVVVVALVGKDRDSPCRQKTVAGRELGQVDL